MSTSPESITYTKFQILLNLFLSRFPKQIPEDIIHVLNMCPTPHPSEISEKITYLPIPLDDIDDITPHIANIATFIDNALSSNGKVLVYCALGINRSLAAVAAYVCHREKINSNKALELIQEKKPDVRPSKISLKQIDLFFRREVEEEDVMVGFHRRLDERKKGLGKKTKR